MHKTKSAQDLIKKGDAKHALEILKPLSLSLQRESSYWTQSANAQMQLHKYNDALQALNTAWLYSSTPEICYLKAKCYEMQSQYLMAEEEYQLASQLEPMRMRPYMALMKLYQKIDEFEKASLMAQYLITFKPKIESSNAKKYKEQASLLLARNRPLNF
ncbi:MAG TPA: hypothetical protein VL125_17135 [Pelobium sp.]|nr:hypothetical protein [Pelobium sp.]